MTALVFGRFALSGSAVAALLAGCGALPLSSSKGQGDMPPPVSASPVFPRSRTIAGHAEHGKSWMAPDAKKSSLLYISDESFGKLYVFSYPKGTLEGTITGLSMPQGLCVDKKGDVFVTTFYAGEILEYAHGGSSSIQTLNNPGEYMLGCSVDPTTGNLAAMDFSTSSGGPASVAIYKKAKGNPTVYSDSDLQFGNQLGYDNHGNIFLDGLSNQGFDFAELPKGSSNFTEISLNVTIDTPGGVQWDGKYVAVGDETGGEIYQTNGSGGKVIGTTKLGGGSPEVSEFFIDGKTVVGPSPLTGAVSFWKYPAGGGPTKTLSNFSEPFGAAVSRVRK
ncbi:MAG TPA: hypothetical protein VGI19_17175 [Candidatus Cybelea sp.]|jgi:hypothetical protein